MRNCRITHQGALDHEPKASISGHSVLPSPDEGLARWISEATPAGALTFSTPWVRVQVTAPPAFDDEAVTAHQERAHNLWADRSPRARGLDAVHQRGPCCPRRPRIRKPDVARAISRG